MSNMQQARTPAPEAAHDPIAIAALVAELPELEAKAKAANEAAKQANDAFNALQQRIDTAFATLKRKAPSFSRWGGLTSSPDVEDMYKQIMKYEEQQRLLARLNLRGGQYQQGAANMPQQVYSQLSKEREGP